MKLAARLGLCLLAALVLLGAVHVAAHHEEGGGHATGPCAVCAGVATGEPPLAADFGAWIQVQDAGTAALPAAATGRDLALLAALRGRAPPAGTNA